MQTTAHVDKREEPRDGKYHDHHPYVRRCLAASVFRVTSASFLRLPPFFPVHWALGPAMLYILTLAAGIGSAIFLGALAALSGNAMLSIAVPVVILLTEFALIPIIKAPALLRKSCASMREFLAEDRQTREAFHNEAHSWSARDWIAGAILTGSFVIKAHLLLAFGAYMPNAVLLTNWIIAIGELAVHLGNVTSKIPYFAIGQTIDRMHRRRRLNRAADAATSKGTNRIGALEFREFEFESPVALHDDEVGSNLLRRDGTTMRWLFKAAGTLSDGDRAALLHRQSSALGQAVLAQELARIQLAQLDAPEQRSGSRYSTQPPPIQENEPHTAPEEHAVARFHSSSNALNGLTKPISPIVLMLATCLLNSCGPVVNSTSGNPTRLNSISVLIVQPAAPEVVNDIVAALVEPLTAIATASNGRNVPVPEIRILNEHGDRVVLPDPVSRSTNLGVILFGDQTPAAKQRRLLNTLTNLEDLLQKGATGKTLDPGTIRTKAEKVFKGIKFSAWNSTGGKTPWEEKDNGITNIDNRSAFVEQVFEKGGNFVVLSDSSSKVAVEGTPNGADVQEPVAPPLVDPIKEEKQNSMVETTPSNRDTIIFDLNYPLNPTTSAPPANVSITLPKGVVALGEPIYFDTNSAKLSPAALRSIKRVVEELKAGKHGSYDRILLVGSADYRSNDARNAELSKQRAATVEAALLREGVNVERSVCIGNSLSSHIRQESELAEQRTVQIYLLPQD